jgi:hypothetical protein
MAKTHECKNKYSNKIIINNAAEIVVPNEPNAQPT